ncbi:MAG: DUF1800 domain-containing protein, partial [Bacteroidetes bacterium]
TGPFGYAEAAHLLRRTTYGPSHQQIKDAVAAGLEATVAQLLADEPMPDPPVNPDFEEDPWVPVGETWVDKPYPQPPNVAVGYRRRSLLAWQIERYLTEGTSAREKMTLFWHNHFVVEAAVVGDPKFLYRYITLLRTNAFGNFRELTKQITIDPAMLRYLNGNQNTNTAPNENYARELLELFTIGKGPQIGPGDYTNYTEDDVIQIARVLTGWRDRGYFSINPDVEVQSFFQANRHDTGDKQLSYHFDNLVISNNWENEYSDLIDIIFSKAEVARFICRKLYRWFIYYDITPQAEADVIEPMAQMLIDNDYELMPVLETFFQSAHFFDMLNVGPMIKNPIDFIMSVFKPFGVEFPQELSARYRALIRTNRLLDPLQMVPFGPPNVAGWPAYYQEPAFYRIWISSSTLPVRQEFTDAIIQPNGIGVGGGNRLRIDVLALVQTLDNPSDPNALIEELAAFMFPQPLTDAQKGYLKEVLIPGLPDYEWTVEYSEWAADPTNEDLAAPVDAKLRNLLQVMMAMPEFYLS